MFCQRVLRMQQTENKSVGERLNILVHYANDHKGEDILIMMIEFNLILGKVDLVDDELGLRIVKSCEILIKSC